MTDQRRPLAWEILSAHKNKMKKETNDKIDTVHREKVDRVTNDRLWWTTR